MKLAITGHRPNKLGNEYDLKGPITDFLTKEITAIIEKEHPLELISGMALGVDTLFALIGIKLGIPVTAAIPFVGQEKIWPAKSQKIYKDILSNPTVHMYIVSDGGYSSNKMKIRNKWMVDNCDKLIAVWDGTPGGTANCVKYANTVNKEIIRIRP